MYKYFKRAYNHPLPIIQQRRRYYEYTSASCTSMCLYMYKHVSVRTGTYQYNAPTVLIPISSQMQTFNTIIINNNACCLPQLSIAGQLFSPHFSITNYLTTIVIQCLFKNSLRCVRTVSVVGYNCEFSESLQH